jgi:hypothetical protein
MTAGDQKADSGTDDTLELLVEFQRAVPDLAAAQGPGMFVQLSIPGGMAAGLARVRALPDRAGVRAFFHGLGYPEHVVRVLEQQLGA